MIAPILNPAGSYDFGAQCWAMFDDVAATDTLGEYVVDVPTAQFGYRTTQLGYEAWCEAEFEVRT